MTKENYWDKLMATDEGAASYMTTYGEGPGSWLRKTIGEFINDGESVLDVGCGPGWNLDHFDQYGPKISDYKGVDYSERFVRVANERHNYTVYPYFVQGDCRLLEEPDESWDVVILQDVLEHTSGYERPMEEALRVARKRIIITFWRGQMLDDFHDDGENHVRDDGDDGFCGEYSKKAWEQYLTDTGYHWETLQSPPDANRWHRVYILDKKEGQE